MPRETRTRKVIPKLRDFYLAKKRVPSMAELCELAGYSAKGSAVYLLASHLIRAGYLDKDSKGKFIATSKLRGGIKILGTVQAGFPSPAEEELIDTISMDDYLIERPEQTYLVKVSGDSMIDAGIRPKDLVIVERGKNPRSGDIVIAQVDGEWTMKYYINKNRRIILRAANKNYPDIQPEHDLTIGGVVTGCIRKYGK